jgi:hypothetical protein
MNMHFEKTVRQLARVARSAAFFALKDNDRLASPESERSFDPRFASTPPLPPTRAVRAPRSRGIFLDRRDGVGPRTNRFLRASLTVLLVGIGGILLAVFASSTSISAVTLNANPGPGIVASASVAPAFMVPAKRR